MCLSIYALPKTLRTLRLRFRLAKGAAQFEDGIEAAVIVPDLLRYHSFRLPLIMCTALLHLRKETDTAPTVLQLHLSQWFPIFNINS